MIFEMEKKQVKGLIPRNQKDTRTKGKGKREKKG